MPAWSGRGTRLQLGEIGSAALDEILQQRWIVRAHGRFHRRSGRKRRTPARQFRLAAENTKIGDLIEHVEISKHRFEHGVDEGERFAVEPGRRDDARLEPREFLRELSGPGFKGGFVGCSVEAGNVVQNSRAKFDPRAMFGARDRIDRVQPPRLRLLQIFEDAMAGLAVSCNCI